MEKTVMEKLKSRWRSWSKKRKFFVIFLCALLVLASSIRKFRQDEQSARQAAIEAFTEHVNHNAWCGQLF
jgi:hypothetical protein